jgi:hypothetical protein
VGSINSRLSRSDAVKCKKALADLLEAVKTQRAKKAPPY